jgi:putative transposase
VPLVRGGAANDVLQAIQGPTEAAGAFILVTSRDYTRLLRGYGLRREFITRNCPQQNDMVERLIRTLKEQCAHRHRLETLQHASRVIRDWIGFYNHRRPHQALAMKTPPEAYALAA